MTDTLTVFGNTFTGVTGIKASDNNSQIKTYVRPQGTLSVTQNGTGIDVTNYAAVDVSVSGGSPTIVEENDVIFADYDGTLLHSYSASEFLALSALPGNPSHSGLIAEGWNWTLSDAKDYVTEYGYLTIGQTYITSDGKTKIYYEIDKDESLYYPASIYFATSVLGGVTIHWGDGSTTVTDSTTAKLYTHTYLVTGTYIIELEVTSGTVILQGNSGNPNNSIGGQGGTENAYNKTRFKKVLCGSNVVISGAPFFTLRNLEIVSFSSTTLFNSPEYLFYSSQSLNCVVIPDGITSVSNSMFRNTYIRYLSLPNSIETIDGYGLASIYKLRKIEIPQNLTSMGTYAFNGLQGSPGFIKIPEGITSILSYTFSNDYRVAFVIIPSTVTSIATYAFSGLSGCKEIHFKSASPPTVANARAFDALPTTCTIYVPTGKLSAYTSATNYPSSSTYTYVEE